MENVQQWGPLVAFALAFAVFAPLGAWLRNRSNVDRTRWPEK